MKSRKHFLKFGLCVIVAMCFNLIVYYLKGERAAIEFFGGYIIEMTLSLDNLFLFIVIFSSFKISPFYQERVLKYGIFLAVILRLIFILLGVSIINKFHFLIYIFGIILIFSGLKIFAINENCHSYENSFIIRLINKIIPVTDRLYGNNFIVVINHIVYATPLLVVLLIIEFSDLIFALDSIPAIFSITMDPFIVYSSNILAILGLRSMYHILAKMNSKFVFMKYGVSLILIFTGIKLSILFFNISLSTLVSVLVILIILLSSILLSLILDTNEKRVNRYK